MTDAAVAAARAAGYRNAGTIEFLVEGRGDAATFYFLEMNTRLQVEHAVTEAVAGVDLVRAQLLVASGEPLPWPDGSLTQRGHAIEARVYAEDPSRGFLPQAGRLLLYREPRLPGVRVDAGVVEGGEVSVHYDPMLAKVIASGETREIADRATRRRASRLSHPRRPHEYPVPDRGPRASTVSRRRCRHRIPRPRRRALADDSGELPPFLRRGAVADRRERQLQCLKPEAADAWSRSMGDLRGWRA